MLSTLQNFEELLSTSIFSSHKKQALSIPEEENLAFFIELESPLNNSERLRLWQAAKDLLPQTGHWPVLIQGGFSGQPWPSSEDLFSRFFYREETNAKIVPAEIIAASNHLSAQDFFTDAMQEEVKEESFLEIIENEIAISAELFEVEEEEIKAWLTQYPIDNIIALEAALWTWEDSKNKEFPNVADFQDWHEPLAQEGEGILFLPTENAWESLAYVHFFGASLRNSATYIAVGKYWQKHYNAEIVAHYGTMLHCLTEKTPTHPLEALTLAYQQRVFAPCTLYCPGISIREHARYLLEQRTWFLHERP